MRRNITLGPETQKSSALRESFRSTVQGWMKLQAHCTVVPKISASCTADIAGF